VIWKAIKESLLCPVYGVAALLLCSGVGAMWKWGLVAVALKASVLSFFIAFTLRVPGIVMRHRMAKRNAARIAGVQSIHSAWECLWKYYWSTPAAKSRGFLLPEQNHALGILQRASREGLESLEVSR
jgi:hypothetical protein